MSAPCLAQPLKAKHRPSSISGANPSQSTGTAPALSKMMVSGVFWFVSFIPLLNSCSLHTCLMPALRWCWGPGDERKTWDLP